MINKKGILLKTVLSIVIALVGILILFYAFYKLYQVGVSQEFENAKKTLENIIVKAEALPDGEENIFTIQGFENGEDWYLTGWAKSESTDEKPEKCFFESCLCVCKGGGTKEKCEKESICRDLKQDNVEAYTNKYESQSLRGISGELFRDCIKLKNNLFEVKIGKRGNLINITHENSDRNLDLTVCNQREGEGSSIYPVQR